MARNDPQMNLRVPMELKEKIEKAALDNGRTITAEAVYRLENSFEGNSYNFNKTIVSDAFSETLAALIEILQEEGVASDKLSIAIQKLGRKNRKAP